MHVLREDESLWTRHDVAGEPGAQLSSWSFVENLKRYAREAGIGKIHLHQTRHTFARMVAKRSGSLSETQDALGHRHASTTRIYVESIAHEMFQVTREKRQGVPLYDLGNHNWDTPWLWTLLKEFISDNREFQAIEVEHDFPAIGRRTVLLDAGRLSREGNPEDMILLAFRDITERKQAEEAVRQSAAQYEIVLRRKDGGEIDISLTVSPIRDKRGRVVGASKISRDISDRKRVETEREELLRRESEARAEAENASRLKDEFLATVSHESQEREIPRRKWRWKPDREKIRLWSKTRS